LREGFLSDLTDAAYRTALRHELLGPFLDVELDLYLALRGIIDRQQWSSCWAELKVMKSGIMIANAVFGVDPLPPGPAPKSPGGGDVLSALLKSCRIECRQTQPWRLTAPWGLEFTKAGPGFVIVLEGAGRLQVSGMADDVTIRKNDFAVLTRDTRLVLRDQPDSRLVAAERMLPSADRVPREAPYLGGGGAITRLLWGGFTGEDDYTRQAFTLLPPLLVAHGDGPDAAAWRPLMGVLLDEMNSRRPGADLLVDRVMHALLVYALRATPLTLPDPERLLPALFVPGMGMALAAINTRPDHDWSVGELAEIAGLSRSKFAIQFVDVFGRPPFDFLRDVRMRLACQLLHETTHGIKEISLRVGYGTDASFSRAFSHWCGCAPGAYRRQKNRPRSAENDSDGGAARTTAPLPGTTLPVEASAMWVSSFSATTSGHQGFLITSPRANPKADAVCQAAGYISGRDRN
jgi:AraC-like DNA-binding protein